MKLKNLNNCILNPDGSATMLTLKLMLAGVLANTPQANMADAERAVVIKNKLIEAKADVEIAAEDYVFVKKTLERAVGNYAPDVAVQLYQYLVGADKVEKEGK